VVQPIEIGGSLDAAALVGSVRFQAGFGRGPEKWRADGGGNVRTGCLAFAVMMLAMFQNRGMAAEPEILAEPKPLRIRIEVSEPGMKSLRRDSRAYVRATVREGAQIWRDAGLHLKGATGSFRPLDDKPAVTIRFDEFVPDQRFHGLSKVHLNNSVEDASYLNEKLGSELFRAANIPAPRVTHAVVELNDRRLGLYVLKEAFAAEFLERHFKSTNGNLYDPGAGSEINGPLKRSSGSGPADGADLRRLVDAAQEPDLGRRWQRLGEVLDVDRFESFMAMEILAGHRDGYCLARNNYRLYHDPASDRFVFLPAGMDQLFGRADLPLHPHFAGLLAQATMETAQGRREYRTRLGMLFTNVLQAPTLTNRVREWAAGLAGGLPRNEARPLERAVAILCKQIRLRTLEVARQLAVPPPTPLAFENGIAKPIGWRPTDKPAGGKLDAIPAPDGRLSFHVRAGPTTSASWRAKLLLAPGRYRFGGRVQTARLKPLPFGRHHGAALDVSGSKPSGVHWATGDSGWTPLEVTFEIRGRETEVDLVCALRASAGEAWFDADSLRIERLP
jgi:hypothetical protein